MSKLDAQDRDISAFAKRILGSTKAKHSETIMPACKMRLLIERGEEDNEYRISVCSEAWMARTYGRPAKAKRA